MNQDRLSIHITNFSPLIYLTILALFLLPKTSLCVDPLFQACVPKSCGDGQINISYPFWIEGLQQSHCGYPGFKLSCNNNSDPILNLSGNTYIVQQIFYNNQSIRVANAGFLNTSHICFPPIHNLTLWGTGFRLGANYTDLFVFSNCSSSVLMNSAEVTCSANNETKCSSSLSMNSSAVTCSANNGTDSVLAISGQNPFLGSLSKSCDGEVVVPVELYEDEGNGTGGNYYEKVLSRGFELTWNVSDCSACKASGGRCGFDEETYHFKCFCPDRPHAWYCRARNNKMGWKLALGITAVGIGVLMFIVCCFWRKISIFLKKENQNHRNVEIFLRNFGSIAPKRYIYSDVKKMTHSFRDKLGQGGYGGVYKGKLHDGRLVAVKVLNKSKGDGEDFINEVASISRTSHVNIVSLLGFCSEGSKRALIYEFMPNGSLEKFIYDQNPLRENRQLGWDTLYQIAIGIARGLEYLHRGCNTRILHFDIKPHNILLDENFCPKISDFGLAKLCPKNESIISMLGARGTAGYIAPEVFCRNIGGVSHKSDVYSYGMMVLEMVGGRRNIDVGVDNTSEIYFPHWIYKRLAQGDQLGLHGIMNEEENEKARKMILVSLWCIQTDPSNRPPIGTVVDMFQGSLGSLQIPPRPFLSSPPRSQADS